MVGALLVAMAAVGKGGALRFLLIRLLCSGTDASFDRAVAWSLAGLASLPLGVNARTSLRFAAAEAVAQCVVNDFVVRVVGVWARVVVALAVCAVVRHHFLVDELLQL